MTGVLAWYNATPLLTLQGSVVYVAIILLLVPKFMLAGLVVTRTGRSFLWALLVLLPFAEQLAPWLLAYVRWPAEGPVPPPAPPAA